jgi:hypothetical protein
LSKKPFQKELAMHRLTFDPGQRRVLLLVPYKRDISIGVELVKSYKNKLLLYHCVFFSYDILISTEIFLSGPDLPADVVGAQPMAQHPGDNITNSFFSD